MLDKIKKLTSEQFEASVYMFEKANGNTKSEYEEKIIAESGLKNLKPKELEIQIVNGLNEAIYTDIKDRISAYWALSKIHNRKLIPQFQRWLQSELAKGNAQTLYQLLIALTNLGESAFNSDRLGSTSYSETDLNIRDAKNYLNTLTMKDDYIQYHQNPKIEILFGFYGGKIIPTKQDKFKPLKAFEVNDNDERIELKNFYERKDDKNSIENMKKFVAEQAAKAFEKKGIIKKPSEVEVILSFSVKEKRFKIVDVDNLSKTILDGLEGVAFEEDSQVSSLIVNKHVHPMKINALFIGITELTEQMPGLGSEITLFS